MIVMKDKVFSIRINGQELQDAKKICNKNQTTLQIQIREFVKRICENENNLLRGKGNKWN